MALPLSPVAVSVPKRGSVQEVMVIDVVPQRSFEAQQARQMHSDGQCVLVDLLSNLNSVPIADESTLHQFPHHQTLIPWTHYEGSDIMAGSSVLSTVPNFSILNPYDNIDHVGSLLAMDSSSRLDSPTLNLSSSIRPKTSFETTVFPGEPVIKTEAEMMANVPRTLYGVRFSSMFKESALDCPFSNISSVPRFQATGI